MLSALASVLCLLLCISYINADPELRLIQTGPNTAPEWLTAAQISKLQMDRINFMDVTDGYIPKAPSSLTKSSFPDQPTQKEYIESLIPGISTEEMKNK